MDDKLPVILEENEELLDIEPVELEVKGKDSDENIKWKGHPHVASRFGTILLSISLMIFGLVVTPIGIITVERDESPPVYGWDEHDWRPSDFEEHSGSISTVFVDNQTSISEPASSQLGQS